MEVPLESKSVACETSLVVVVVLSLLRKVDNAEEEK